MGTHVAPNFPGSDCLYISMFGPLPLPPAQAATPQSAQLNPETRQDQSDQINWLEVNR